MDMTHTFRDKTTVEPADATATWDQLMAELTILEAMPPITDVGDEIIDRCTDLRQQLMATLAPTAPALFWKITQSANQYDTDFINELNEHLLNAAESPAQKAPHTTDDKPVSVNETEEMNRLASKAQSAAGQTASLMKAIDVALNDIADCDTLSKSASAALDTMMTLLPLALGANEATRATVQELKRLSIHAREGASRSPLRNELSKNFTYVSRQMNSASFGKI